MSVSQLPGLPTSTPRLAAHVLPSQAPVCRGSPPPSALAGPRSSSARPFLGACALGAVVGGRQRLPQLRRSCRKAPLSPASARVHVVRAAAAQEEEEGQGGSFDDISAEEALAALEVELEGLEEELGGDLVEALEERQAKLNESVGKILERAPAPRASSVTPGSGLDRNAKVQRVAVCGFFSDSGAGVAGVGGRLLARLREEGQAEPQMLDLQQLPSMPFEKVDNLLAGCESAVICAEAAAGGDESQALEDAKQGLKAALPSFPDSLTKVVLLSRAGAQDGKGGFNFGSFFDGNKSAKWADLEDELTSCARKRTSNSPLHVLIVRTGELTAAASTGTVVRCVPAGERPEATTTVGTATEAIYQALKLGADTSFCVVDAPGAALDDPDWPEMLLPFAGPEVWRSEVDSVRRAAIFVQGWAEEFFGQGKSAMRLGVKTPVQLQKTPSGVIFKFRPLSTDDEVGFEELQEGGVEFVAEEPEGMPPRLRIKRVGYGWKVSVKENSEKALLSKFEKDWAEVS